MFRWPIAICLVWLLHAVTAEVVVTALQPENFDTTACVEVRWTHLGSSGDTSDDWVSSWWDPYEATYIEFVNVTASTVNGSYCFTLLNARHGYHFRYYRGNTILARSNKVFPNGAYPRSIRTSFPLRFPGSLRVAWISNRTLGPKTVARYGRSPDALTQTAIATWDSFTHDELNAILGEAYVPIMNTSFADIASRNIRCSPSSTSVDPIPCYCDRTTCEQFVEPGYLHSAILTNLDPSALYYYSVGEVGGPVSPVYSIRSPRPPGDMSQVSILLMADGGFGQSYNGFTGGALHNHHKPNGADLVFAAVDKQYDEAGKAIDDFALFNGDLSYAQGWPYAWEFFHNMTERVYRHVPVAASYGNHEVDWTHNPDNNFEVRGQDSGGECGVEAQKRFYIENPWYTFSYGPVTIVTLSSEHNMSQQVTYFKAIAPTINRTLTPWLLVQIHRPMYTSSFMEVISWELRNAFNLLFSQYAVDVVYTGHMHFYERTCHISDDVCADWGFRDTWVDQEGIEVAEHCAMTWLVTFDMTECRAQCAWNSSSCVGIMYDSELRGCFPLQCLDDPTPSTWSTLGAMTVHEGSLPPFYVLDGVAGAEPEPAWTFSSMYTRYKDFWKWGFSRIKANATDLEFLHYHVDGKVHDSTHVRK